jgi:hypothetical protein
MGTSLGGNGKSYGTDRYRLLVSESRLGGLGHTPSRIGSMEVC